MTDLATTTEATTPTAPTFADVAAEVFGSDAPAEVTETLAEAPAGQKAEEVKDPKAERVGSRIAAAKMAEKKTERERIELRTQKEAHDKRAADLDAREKRLRLIEDDPIKFFEEFKSDPKTFLDKLAGDYKPENVATKKLTAVEEEVQRLKTELTQRDEAAKQAQTDSAWKEAGAAWLSHVGEQAEKYPHLTDEFTEQQALALAHSELTAPVGKDSTGALVSRSQAYFREHGVYPDFDVIAEHLDLLAKQRIEARTKSAWRKQGNGADPASKAALNGDPKSVPSVKGTSPRTLTSRDASQRSSAPKVWSQEAADEECIRILEQGMRKA